MNFGNFTVIIQVMAETFGLETKKNMQTFVNREPFEIPWTKKILCFCYDFQLFSCSQFKSTINKL